VTRTRILVVDDNDTNQKVAVGLLTSLGYESHVATSGREAVDAVLRTAFAAVLMDCQMPVMDGYQATAAIRTRETTRRTPIIAVTAGDLDVDKAKCLAAGMDDFLSKPILRTDLARALARAVLPEARADNATRAPSATTATVTATASASGRGPELSYEILAALRELEEKSGHPLIAALIDTYFTTTQRAITDLHRALSRDDVASVASIAHRSKGGSHTVGAVAVAGLFDTIERAATAGDGPTVAEAAQLLPAALARARAAFDSENR
jgi:CheY-like chemotaxis protein